VAEEHRLLDPEVVEDGEQVGGVAAQPERTRMRGGPAPTPSR
jgi:hypothetical protein